MHESEAERKTREGAGRGGRQAGGAQEVERGWELGDGPPTPAVGGGRRGGGPPRRWGGAAGCGTCPQHQRLGADPLWPVSAAPEPSPAVRAETWPPPRVRHGRRASPCLTLIPRRLQMLEGGGGHSLESSTRNRVFRVAPLPAHPVHPDLAALLPWPGLCSVSSLWMAEGESACVRAELLPLTTLHVL